MSKIIKFINDDKIVAIAFSFVILSIVAIFFPWDEIHGIKIFKWYLETKTYNNLGDFVSGISTPFIGLATFIIAFKVFILQKEELKKTTDALHTQNKTIEIQRFENTFFHMLETHHHIVESMDVISKAPNYSEAELNIMSNWKFKPQTKDEFYYKRDCFKFIFDGIQIMTENNKFEDDDDKILVSYDRIQDIYKADLHHYYRFLYRILKFIKMSRLTENEKYNYASILRATLSPYELAMLFYNGLHKFGCDKFKPLLEEYSFFKNLDFSLLLDKNLPNNQRHYQLYNEIATLKSHKNIDIVVDRDVTYKLWLKDKIVKQ